MTAPMVIAADGFAGLLQEEPDGDARSSTICLPASSRAFALKILHGAGAVGVVALPAAPAKRPVIESQ